MTADHHYDGLALVDTCYKMKLNSDWVNCSLDWSQRPDDEMVALMEATKEKK